MVERRTENSCVDGSNPFLDNLLKLYILIFKLKMAFKFILLRTKKKKNPFFRIFVKHVETNRCLDKIGYYIPLSKIVLKKKTRKRICINLNKFFFWKHRGAIFSNLLLIKVIYWLFICKINQK